MFSTRLDPADSRRGIASFHNLFFYLYIYITVYKSEIRFNPMVEKNRNVEEYDIYGIYLHGYLRDFDRGIPCLFTQDFPKVSPLVWRSKFVRPVFSGATGGSLDLGRSIMGLCTGSLNLEPSLSVRSLHERISGIHRRYGESLLSTIGF